MERKPHGGVGGLQWGVAASTLASVFSFTENHSIKNNSNNDDKVMLWISSTVNLRQQQQRSQREFSSVFTTTNQNYVARHCV